MTQMVSPDVLSAALLRAGVNDLRPAARVYLANRLTRQAANGGLTETNLGGLRNLSFGAAHSTAKLAAFASIDDAAKALVMVADRAAPRAWREPSADIGEVASPIGPPDRIPLPIRGGVEYVPTEEAITRGAVRNSDGSWDLSVVPLGELTDFKWQYLIPGYGPYAVARDYLGPTEDAQRAFRELVADWEGYERLGVGEKIFGPGDPRGNLRDTLIEWRKFRDDWLAGNIPNADVASRLNVARSDANKVRKYLAEAKVIDPALADPAFDKSTGVTAETATTVTSAAASVERSAKTNPLVNFLTDPAGLGSTVNVPLIGPVPKKTVLVTSVAGVAALALYMYARSRPMAVVVEGSVS